MSLAWLIFAHGKDFHEGKKKNKNHVVQMIYPPAPACETLQVTQHLKTQDKHLRKSLPRHSDV